MKTKLTHTQVQRGFINCALDRPDEWTIVNQSVQLARPKNAPPLLIPAQHTLVALCNKIFASSCHHDDRVRTAICNIVLQRIQGNTPIALPVRRTLADWVAAREKKETATSKRKRE